MKQQRKYKRKYKGWELTSIHMKTGWKTIAKRVSKKGNYKMDYAEQHQPFSKTKKLSQKGIIEHLH